MANSFAFFYENKNVSLFERKTPLSLDVRSVHFVTPKVLDHSVRTYERKGYCDNSERNQSDMIVLFLKIYLIVAELSSPPLLNDVRRITYGFVQAIEEAQENKTSFD